MTITLYDAIPSAKSDRLRSFCMHLIRLSCENGNPELFVLPAFPLAIANLAGMTTQLFPKPLHHADSRPEIC